MRIKLFINERRVALSAQVYGLLLLSRLSSDAALQTSGEERQPAGDDIILEQLRLTHTHTHPHNQVFTANHIAASFHISSGHLNPLMIHQDRRSHVYCKSPGHLGHLVWICTVCLVLINLC